MANICKNLKNDLEANKLTFCLYDDFMNNKDNDPENATSIYVRNLDFSNGWESYFYKLPKNKTVDFEWVMNKWQKSTSPVFNNFINDFKKLLKKMGINDYLNCYATSYGIGVSVIFSYRGSAKKYSDKIAETLKNIGIEFTNEFSDAGWVFRYKISKKQSNLDKIKTITL